MDADVARLAERVASAADAWLRDPQDVQVYGRLVAATLAWRQIERLRLDEDPLLLAGAGPAEQADPTTVPHRLGDALGDVLAELKLRRPHDD